MVKIEIRDAMRKTGDYEKLGDLSYFIPHSLPPAEPGLELTTEIMTLYGEASFSLGQLNEMSQRLPNLRRFIKAYVLKEALLSSEIEGIHTTLIDVFTHTLNDTKISKDTQLVLNYIKSLDVALQMIKDKGLPLASRVILAAHEVLMEVGDRDRAAPGHYRQQSVRVGDLIPPPAPRVPELMSNLEKYINEPSDLPSLIKAGLAHIQFETIHPFLDGNGRIGRLLIVLMLINSGILDAPILYPSYYFKKHRFEYYQTLDRVRTHGDFEGWIAYYLKAIKDSSIDAHRRAKEIELLEKELKNIIQSDNKLSKVQKTTIDVANALFEAPVTSITEISNNIGKSYNTVYNVIKRFLYLGIVIEKEKGGKRNQLYRFEPYISLLEKEY